MVKYGFKHKGATYVKWVYVLRTAEVRVLAQEQNESKRDWEDNEEKPLYFKQRNTSERNKQKEVSGRRGGEVVWAKET